MVRAALWPWLALVLLSPAPVRAQAPDASPAPTVQREWRLLAIGMDVGPRLRVRPLLAGVERALRRELPGLEVRFDRERWRDFPGPSALEDDGALAIAALERAQAAGLDPAGYSVVFVLSPRCREPFFGQAHRAEWRAPDGRPARVVLIQSAPFQLIYDGLLAALDGQSPFPDEPQPGLPPALRDALRAALHAGREPLRALCELPGVREALLAPTIAHELGHCFAPGDVRVEDGYQRPWLRHATGPDDNPDGHDLGCCLYKGRGPTFYLRKLLATRGRLVVFCDACRAKLGLAADPSHTDTVTAAAASSHTDTDTVTAASSHTDTDTVTAVPSQGSATAGEH